MRANIQSRSPATASPGRLCMKPEIRGISGEFGDSAKLLELLRQLTSGPASIKILHKWSFPKRQTLEYKWEINKPVEATLSDLDLTSLQSFILPFQRNLAPALLWTGKVLSGLGWRDSGKSCSGWQWAKLEEKGREGVATHHLLPNGAKPCNPHLHPLPNLLL